jgi:hypothetical protein
MNGIKYLFVSFPDGGVDRVAIKEFPSISLKNVQIFAVSLCLLVRNHLQHKASRPQKAQRWNR